MTTAKTKTYLKNIVQRLQEIEVVYDEKVTKKTAIMNRLTYILGDDAKLAKTVYDYIIRGHLSYGNTLKERLSK